MWRLFSALLVCVLSVARIAGTSFSLFIIFIPVYVAASCLVCCACLFICCARGDIDDLDHAHSHAHDHDEHGHCVTSTETSATQGADSATHTSYGTYQPPVTENGSGKVDAVQQNTAAAQAVGAKGNAGTDNGSAQQQLLATDTATASQGIAVTHIDVGID